jgi:hypothetical protein
MSVVKNMMGWRNWIYLAPKWDNWWEYPEQVNNHHLLQKDSVTCSLLIIGVL